MWLKTDLDKETVESRSPAGTSVTLQINQPAYRLKTKKIKIKNREGNASEKRAEHKKMKSSNQIFCMNIL